MSAKYLFVHSKYRLVPYNLSENGETGNCFYNKLGKGAYFSCVRKGDWNSVPSVFIPGCP